MEKFVYYNYLYDIYKSFLTEKNCKIFEYYYSENLSMQEIADLLKVSKSFVGSSIKTVEKKLDEYEKKLHVFEHKKKLQDLLDENDVTKIKNEIKKIIND